MTGRKLCDHPAHLGRNASVAVEPRFTASLDWYQGYVERHAGDGAEGRLVSLHTFHGPWTTWEMHPHGGELVLCIAGVITLHQEQTDGSRSSITLAAGEYAINDPGVWHTADVDGEATAVFITAGLGTELKSR